MWNSIINEEIFFPSKEIEIMKIAYFFVIVLLNNESNANFLSEKLAMTHNQYIDYSKLVNT